MTEELDVSLKQVRLEHVWKMGQGTYTSIASTIAFDQRSGQIPFRVTHWKPIDSCVARRVGA